ncbi:glucosaminidase domain-containing protein [Flavobacterium sp.]|uniref:glucosaminidase domain-containing protein n=1 Tax=Flavobacterium sp. TaxID=239 RepID=UPI002614E125|nr:glucosaminidase domain-containing protein [Flavobacterium sp.]MDD3005312.1 glucosaminidase domain-containing protein [Flavobacterium sp.]
MIRKIAGLLIMIMFVSCGSSNQYVQTSKKKPVVSKKGVKNNSTPTRTANRETETMISTSKTTVYTDVVFEYIHNFKDIAKSNMKDYGIPASIILAQGILESGAGRGELAKRSNNHFGIKCHTGWEGEKVYHDDDAEQECFRKYTDPAQSYKDHALFLTGRSRYSNLFKLGKDDYQAWAKGLRNAGYATDPKYPDKLINYIEKYNLHQYDAEVLGKNYTVFDNAIQPIAVSSQKIDDLYQVQQGETLYSISKKFNISVESLKQKNNLIDNTISIGQRLIVK